jgi:ADP-heptose:LPS heptosyltransferase
MTEPTKLILVSRYSPGDVLMLTAAVRDLHAAYPGQYLTGVECYCPDLWQYNPYISPVRRGDGDVMEIDCANLRLLNHCNGQPRHYIEAVHYLLWERLGKPVPLTRFAPELHVCAEEAAAPPHGLVSPYWLIFAGGKRDLTTKWWPRANYQSVVDRLRGKVRLVQVGSASDHHPPLRGVKNLVGRTTLRDLVRLVYHCQGVICPITSGMHLAAAFDKPCVVIAGGREPPHWEMYPGHQYLHTVGELACCARGGCWRARVVPLKDGADSNRSLCSLPVRTNGTFTARCMTLIEPPQVTTAVRRYLTAIASEDDPLTAFNASARVARVARRLKDCPGRFRGRGIIVPAGGPKLLPSAWVCIRSIRRTGCRLPIELWHLNGQELDPAMRGLLETMEVRCVNAEDVRGHHPVRHLGGWELKPYAILHSRFRHVLLLDADNMPVEDPSFLFDTGPYRRHGAVFWPDHHTLPPQQPIWRLMGVPWRDEPAVESGQLLVDKVRCWKPLSLTMWMNEHSDFWYHHIYGDKDTYPMAWRRLRYDYAMPGTPLRWLHHPATGRPAAMCQHDFEGRRLFQHRNTAKWQLNENPRIPGFLHEDECLADLADLASKWGVAVG